MRKSAHCRSSFFYRFNLQYICRFSSNKIAILPELLYIEGISLYVLSFVGDLFDGMAARKFHQTSKFGGLLDMVTDRCATLGLLFILSGEYSHGEYSSIFKLVSCSSSSYFLENPHTNMIQAIVS